jgi:hypothetical protein
MKLAVRTWALVVALIVPLMQLQTLAQKVQYPTDVLYPVYYDTSPPLSEMIANAPPWEPPKAPPGKVPREVTTGASESEQVCAQNYFGSSLPLSMGVDFEGIGYSGITPPDPNGAVGPNHYFQVVNSHFAILDKHSIA